MKLILKRTRLIGLVVVLFTGMILALFLVRPTSELTCTEVIDSNLQLFSNEEVTKWATRLSGCSADVEEVARHLEDIGFAVIVHTYPQDHFRFSEQDIIAFWSRDRHDSVSPFGLMFGWRNLTFAQGTTLYIVLDENMNVKNVSLSYPML